MTVTDGSAVAGDPWWRRVSLGRWSAVILGGIFLLYFGLSEENYLTAITFESTLNERVTIGFMTLGLLVPLAAGTFDLSVGAMVGFSGMVLTWIEKDNELGAGNVWLGIIVVLAMCAAFGFVSGFLVVKLRINSFIATLGMSQVISAALLWRSDNQRLSDAYSDDFREIARGDFFSMGEFGVPKAFIYLLVASVIIWYLLEYTPSGRKLFATGGNPDAARLAGVRTGRYIWSSLVVSAVLAGIGGIILAMRQGAASPQTGPPLLFPAFAAVFFGATQIKNRPNVWGTVIAIYVLAFGARGFQLKSPGVWVDPLFNGVALVVAVAAASIDWGAVRRGYRRRFGGDSATAAEA
jgi:ribose transport system permease protein